MPTASAHLAAVLDLLDDPALAARQRLASDEQRGALLLGSISPDVRVVSGQAREKTHFYDIPLSRDMPASQALLRRYPTLAKANGLPPRQAAFIAGYITHLVMDEAWLEFVVMPHIFIDETDWSRHHPNFRLYSLLMTYLAEEGSKRITPELVAQLQATEPRNWLPFASDADLVEWRDRVAEHLLESGWQTARMFAREMKVDTDELYVAVTSKEALDRELFSAVPRDALDAFQRHTHQRCTAALNAYLAAPGA